MYRYKYKFHRSGTDIRAVGVTKTTLKPLERGNHKSAQVGIDNKFNT